MSSYSSLDAARKACLQHERDAHLNVSDSMGRLHLQDQEEDRSDEDEDDEVDDDDDEEEDDDDGEVEEDDDDDEGY